MFLLSFPLFDSNLKTVVNRKKYQRCADSYPIYLQSIETGHAADGLLLDRVLSKKIMVDRVMFEDILNGKIGF
jgi:hypothetical protein